MKHYYDGKVIIVTGGGSGIGREIVRQLARQGAKVVIAGRNERAGNKVVKELAQEGRHVESHVLDLTNRQKVEELIIAVVSEHGRLDMIFNGVGIVQGGELQDTPLTDSEKVIDTNMHSTLYGTHFAYRQMVSQHSGHVINFASAAGLVPTPAMSLYTASKYGIVGFSHALRIEAAELGIKVSVVCPGLVRTPIYETAMYNGIDKDESLDLLFHKIPIQSPEAAARKILKGTAKNKMTIHTWHSMHVVWILYRISPALYGVIARIAMRRLRASKLTE